jgi:BioD-like phosphotransacetylase family protein
LILGISKAFKKKIAYLKPFGDRIIYRKKRLWDYDAALVKSVLNLKEKAEDITIGFEHSKLKYMYKKDSIKKKLDKISKHFSKKKQSLFIEAGKDLCYGSSINLDGLSLAKFTNAKLTLVVSGDNESILDDILFFKRRINYHDIEFSGVIINKVADMSDFKNNLKEIKELGINVLGVIPYKKELTDTNAEYISDVLMGKVVAGEKGLKNKVKNILVGAMSTDAVLRKPIFKREKKLLITGGDRSDMILAGIESNAAAIVITNGILPPANIISLATENKVPLILSSEDTFKVAKKIDDMERLITKDDKEKIDLITKLVKKHVRNIF